MNLDIIRKIIECSLKNMNVKALFTPTVLKILLFVTKSYHDSQKVNISVENP